MTNKHSYSFDSLKRMSESPVTELAKKFVLKKQDNILAPTQFQIGKEVNTALTNAFQFLKEKKETFKSQDGKSANPSESIVSSWIKEAETVMSSKLKTHSAIHLGKGAKKILNNYGSNYLKNAELEMSINTPMSAEVLHKSGSKYGIKGTADVTFYDAKAKAMEILNIRNEMNANAIATFDEASLNLKTKSDAFLAFQSAIKEGKQVDKLSVSRGDNRIFGDVLYANQSYNKEQILGDLQTELSVEMAKAAGQEQLVYDRLKKKENILDAYSGAFSEIIQKTGCNPGPGCKTCMMKYSCHYRFANDIGEKLLAKKGLGTTAENEKIALTQDLERRAQGIIGGEDSIPSDQIRDYRDFQAAQKKDWANRNHYQRDYDIKMNGALQRHESSQREMYLNNGMEEIAADMYASDDAKILRDSIDVAKRYKRGQFEDSILDKSLLEEGKLQYSVLDIHKKTPHVWLSDNILRTVKAISYDTVNNVMKNMEINRPAMTDRVIDNLFKNKKFVTSFNDQLADNAASELKRKGLIHNQQNIIDVMKDSNKMIDKNLANNLMEELNKATIDEIWRVDSNALSSKIDPRIEFQRSNYDAVFNSAKSKNLLDMDPDSFRKKIIEVEGGFSKPEKFKLSMPRNTISTIGKALILSQLAGNETILNMVNNKVSKVAEFMNTQERKIDTGEHNSTYGTMRRLILSDFGSKIRFGTMMSDVYSWVAAKGDHALKMAKDTAADYALKSGAAKIQGDHLALTPDNYIYGGVAAAVGVGMYSIVPRSPSREEAKKQEQAKKKELKKTKRPQRSSDSYNQNPQSELREQYKIHGQFGSPFLGKVGVLLHELSTSKYVGKLMDGSLALTKQLYSHSEEWVAKLKLGSSRASVLSESSTGNNVIDIIDDAAKTYGTELSKAESFIDEKKVGVVSRFRLKEMKDSGLNNIRSIMDNKEISNKVANSLKSPTNLVSGSQVFLDGKAKNNQPVIVKPEQSQHDNIILTTNRNQDTYTNYRSTGNKIKEKYYHEISLPESGNYRGDNNLPSSISGKIRTSDTHIINAYRHASSLKSKAPILTMDTPISNSTSISTENRLPSNRSLSLSNNGVDITVNDRMSMIEANKANYNAMYVLNQRYNCYGGQRPLF